MEEIADARVVAIAENDFAFEMLLVMTSIVWTRNCSALAILALNGVALKSASTRTMFARSSATMGLA